MEAAPGLTAAFAALRSAGTRFHTASDAELLADGEVIEALGRLVDAHRFGFAAEVEQRSASGGLGSLAFRNGSRDGVDLVAHTARIGRTTAKRRVGLGSALAPRVSLRGDLLPGDFPFLADAVAAGEVGVESAEVIVTTVRHLQPRVEKTHLRVMIEALTDQARASETELIREAAATWAAFLDPDGAEPGERTQRLKRAFRLGRTLADGTTRASMILTAEDLAMVKELLQSRRRNGGLVRTEAGGGETCEGIDPQWQEGAAPDGGSPRTRPQQDYDSVVEALTAGWRAEQDGAASSTAATHEVVIQISAQDVEARRGQGWSSGILTGFPIPVVERVVCSGGTRLLVTGDLGEALYLSRARRVFSRAQKKALIVAAGGRCEFPGCTATDPYLEAHHAAWFHRDGGPTDISNGIMLCSYHHHLVHATTSPVRIRRWAGDLWIVPTRWTGDPLPQHRRQRGPITDPRSAHGRPEPDPPPAHRPGAEPPPGCAA